ncbi:hypothetical protein GQ457_09G023550 [Hibiscus cannabinus]
MHFKGIKVFARHLQGLLGNKLLRVRHSGRNGAIQDGVDVLSLSLGSGFGLYYRDTFAIGAFTAMKKIIFVSCSPDNSGPTKASLTNVSPWIMTVKWVLEGRRG